MYVSIELRYVDYLVILASREHHDSSVLLQYSVPRILCVSQSLVIWIKKKSQVKLKLHGEVQEKPFLLLAKMTCGWVVI